MPHSPTPRDYQLEALSGISSTLKSHDRAHVVMACGTGKTLLALWAAEARKPRQILVLVPSITLLQQTLGEWKKYNRWDSRFRYLCVCSDASVAAGSDAIEAHVEDLNFGVSTNAADVNHFLSSPTGIKVIFSTYHSSKVVAKGARGLKPFDVAIFDEAHKTTGREDAVFSHCLSEKHIRIRKRIFFTATPRLFDLRNRDRHGDLLIASMDDEEVYGPCAYRLTFGGAAARRIICNYKIIISAVTDKDVAQHLLKSRMVLTQGDTASSKWIANQIAIQRAVEISHAKRIITFHSRVSHAKEFTSEGLRSIGPYLPDYSLHHVNGKQRSADRRQTIDAFRDTRSALISNARCLTEGIDVPAVDMVVFIDPKHSRVDIAQATGRAMRKAEGNQKKFGYIVFPVIVDSSRTLEDGLKQANFSDIYTVLNAMQDQDDDLVQIVRKLNEDKGYGQADFTSLADRIILTGPTLDAENLKNKIYARIVDALGSSWDEWYGRLKRFKDLNGHCSAHVDYQQDGFRLGAWVSNQRSLRNHLTAQRRALLDDIGFIWDIPSVRWEEGLASLASYTMREGNCHVPVSHKEDAFKLGQWVAHQRANRLTLSQERIARLEALGFIWTPLDAKWEIAFSKLMSYREREGNCLVSQKHVEDGFRLGAWVSSQRMQAKGISAPRRERLNSIGFVWNAYDDEWAQGFDQLQEFHSREGHCRVSYDYRVNGFRLGFWVSNQRTSKAKLSDEKRDKLDALGFVWNPNSMAWERGFAHLQTFVAREGHCRVPQRHQENGFRLGAWVSEQRSRRTIRNDVTNERETRLRRIGFFEGS